MTTKIYPTMIDILDTGIPSNMNLAKKQVIKGRKPTNKLNYLYHGYAYQGKSEGTAAVYEIKPYKPKQLGMIWSKTQLEPFTNQTQGSRTFLRVFPYPRLYAKVNYKPDVLPHWVFYKGSYNTGNVEVSSWEDSTLSFYINNGRLLYLFRNSYANPGNNFNMDTNYVLGYGAWVDDIVYPNLGHTYSKTRIMKKSYTVSIASTGSGESDTKRTSFSKVIPYARGEMCYGNLNFMKKPDEDLDQYNTGTAYGWNTDLTKIMNVSSLSSVNKDNILEKLTLGYHKDFNMSGISKSSYGSTFARDHHYLMIKSLAEILLGKSPTRIGHPENPNVILYNTDLFLLWHNNDNVVNRANLNAIKRCRYNSSISDDSPQWETEQNFIPVDELVSDNSWERIKQKILSMEENSICQEHPINIYNFIFKRILDKEPGLLDYMDTTDKKIFIMHAAIQKGSYILSTLKDKSIEECWKEGPRLREIEPELYTLILKIASNITEDIVVESLKEFNEVVYSLQ